MQRAEPGALRDEKRWNRSFACTGTGKMNSVLNHVVLTIFSQYVQPRSGWGKAAGKFRKLKIAHHRDTECTEGVLFFPDREMPIGQKPQPFGRFLSILRMSRGIASFKECIFPLNGLIS